MFVVLTKSNMPAAALPAIKCSFKTGELGNALSFMEPEASITRMHRPISLIDGVKIVRAPGPSGLVMGTGARGEFSVKKPNP